VAGSVPEHIVQQIARSVDFARIVGRYCELTRHGNNYRGLCPFHKEKTPSFSVDPERGLYYCFGCKEGGNVFTFLEKMEGMTFPEALRSLAAEAGVDLSQYVDSGGPSRSELTCLREINELATTFYEKCLQKAKGSSAVRDYLAERQISPESAERWRLGYAPDGWDHFLKCAVARKYDPELVVKAGLALPRRETPGHYDRFRNRLMFPIADARGRTIGFGARAVKPGDEPKYLNSPETPLFSKGRCFFGLSNAKEAIRSSGAAAVLEGYTDVIMAHQHGIAEAVAVLGTALTVDHGRVLSRLCDRVILVFDGDEAGRKSALRSIEVLLNEDIEIRAVALPAGQDPCECILAEGGEAFRQRLRESQGFFEFRLDAARRDHDTSTIEGATAAFRELAQMALAVRDEARRDIIIRRLAHELGVRETYARSYVQRNTGPRRRQHAPGETAPTPARLSADRTLPAELLGLLLEHPDLIAEATGCVDVGLLTNGHEKELLAELLGGGYDAGTGGVKQFIASIADPHLAAAAARAVSEERIRKERITRTSAKERLADYAAYLARKSRTLPVLPVSGADDAQLRAVQQRLRAQDKRSAQSR